MGFAAEGEDFEARAGDKLRRKGLDAIVGNDISAPGLGFGSDENAGVMIFRDGTRLLLERSSKRQMAERILDGVLSRLRSKQS